MNDPNVHNLVSKDVKTKESNTDHGQMEELKSFAQDTTLHGARFLFAENVLRRLVWTLAILSCFGYCGFQVYTCVDAFKKRPFNTKIATHISTDSSGASLSCSNSVQS